MAKINLISQNTVTAPFYYWLMDGLARNAFTVTAAKAMRLLVSVFYICRNFRNDEIAL